MSKIIFCDIDGVLNTEANMDKLFEEQRFNEPGSLLLKVRDEFGATFCPDAVERLERLVKQTGAKIVISSTWRSAGVRKLQAMFNLRGHDIDVYDVTPVSNTRYRGTEIKQWLDESLRAHNVEKYVILDDDDDMLTEQFPHFVHCWEKDGFNERCYQEALAILS